MKITLFDRVGFPVESQRAFTENGFLRVPGRVARTGIQQYLASELGLTDRPGHVLVNVYRPPEEVFKPESLSSYDNADITDDHPSDLVDASTFKDVSVGHAISAGRQDGDFVIVDLLIKAEDAIKSVLAGKSELSAGYTSVYLHQPGISPDGIPYEFIQTDIFINHIALCDTARAGHAARLFDNKPREIPLMHKVTLDSGVVIEVADTATQSIIQSTFDTLRKRVSDAEEEKMAAEARADAKDEENEELREKASEDSISRRLSEVVAAKDSALKIAGKDFVCDSVCPLTIKRKALDTAGIKCKKYISWDKAPEAYVSAYFDAEEERKENEDQEEEEERQNANDSINRIGNELGGKITFGDAETQRAAHRKAFLDKRYNRGSNK